MKSLKLLLKETLLREIFRDPRRPRKQNSSSFIDNDKTEVFDGSSESPFAWAILVVDSSTLRILQSCFQTHELTSENIACIEMLHNNKRSPTPLHAIYFLSVVRHIIIILKILNIESTSKSIFLLTFNKTYKYHII